LWSREKNVSKGAAETLVKPAGLENLEAQQWLSTRNEQFKIIMIENLTIHDVITMNSEVMS